MHEKFLEWEIEIWIFLSIEGDPLDLFANTGTITLIPEGAIELSLSGGELNTGEEIVIEVSLNNDVAVGSFQIYIKDTPF